MKIHFRISLSSKNCFVWWKRILKILKWSWYLIMISEGDRRTLCRVATVRRVFMWMNKSIVSFFFCSCAFKLKSVIYIKCFKMKARDRGLSISSSLSLFIFFYFSLFFQFTNFVAANSSLVRCSSHYAPGY